MNNAETHLQDCNRENSYVFNNIDFSEINNLIISTHSAGEFFHDSKRSYNIYPEHIEVDSGLFTYTSSFLRAHQVSVYQQNESLILTCDCEADKQKMCEHQSQVLYDIVNKSDLRIFFDKKLRREKLLMAAQAYGLENESNLDQYFTFEYSNRKLITKLTRTEIFPVTKESLSSVGDLLNINNQQNLSPAVKTKENIRYCVVFKQHKYYKHLFIELYEPQFTKDGTIKNPLNILNPLDFVWKAENIEEVKFYTAITRFQNNYSVERSSDDLEALKAVIKNPANVNFYYHNKEKSENITANSIIPVKTSLLHSDITLTVNRKGNFYELLGSIRIAARIYDLTDLQVKFNYFIFCENRLNLVASLDVLFLIDFFKKQPKILVHKSKFDEFRTGILENLQDKIFINYTYIEEAANEQNHQEPEQIERIIYLSDAGHHIIINPVIKYGNIEIPILTKRQIYTRDSQGKMLTVKRNTEAEVNFVALLLKQHPHFHEQLDEGLLYFYLDKDRFLDEDWFLNVFEEWENQRIQVLGFNNIKENKLNQHKAKITIQVTSGINWFNTQIDVRFGKKKASLKQLHRSVRNKNKFVQLDDGTNGILPTEWLEKLSAYFNSGQINGDILQTSKANFSTIDNLYDAAMLSEEVKEEIDIYQKKFSDFESIKDVSVPYELQGTLRTYQKQGLKWLNFLDDFNFGGCLADDMGLGKSVQILAFILLQRSKIGRNTNLLIVPTSLLFNWLEEIQKFAPSLKVLTVYGPDRVVDLTGFDQHEIILTTYGTLLSDINHLKKYKFNYIFLDESQNIKNPDSQRYKAVCLLNSRNKITISGTPIENNTFDLYGQLSFACPGLLGTKNYFRDIYSIPIDRYKDSRRALELQNKVTPFILRRTKQQVASDLPDKTEMVIYCPLKDEQRKVYDLYEKEFRDFISSTTDEDLPKRSIHVLKGLTRLRQICNSPILMKEEKLIDDSSSKIEILLEQIESKSAHHKIVIFSQFVSMLNLIRGELDKKEIAYEYLTGSTKNRESVVNSFKNNEGTRVFLISLKAGGVGLNLTEADYVYIVDPWWNPAVENQAIDRIYRIGQKKNVVAVRLICPETIEEKIVALQKSKTELVNNLIESDNKFLKSLSKAELLRLFNTKDKS